MSNDSIINKFVNNLPIELHLFDPVVGKYSACGPGTKHKERTKRYMSSNKRRFLHQFCVCIE